MSHEAQAARGSLIVRKTAPDGDAARRRKAVKRLSLLELATGKSPEWWDAWHEENRARVRARYGLRP